MCEPQEVESLWSSQTRPCSLSGSKPPKLDQSGLALIERQAEFSQSLPECLQQPSCVAFILGSNDAIIGIAHNHDLAVRMSLAPLVYPSIEGVVQEDVGEDWADHSCAESVPGAAKPTCRSKTVARRWRR